MWVYGNRRNECTGLLLGAVVLLGVSQILEGLGSPAAAMARGALIGLAIVVGVGGLWLHIARKG